MSETDAVQATTSTSTSTSTRSSSTATSPRPETNRASERARTAPPPQEAREQAPARDKAEISREDPRRSDDLVGGMSDAYRRSDEGPTTRNVPKEGRVTTWPDGRSRTEKPDGTVEKSTPGGRTTTRRPDGSVTVEDGGRTRTRHADGRIDLQVIREDGSRLERSTYTRNGAEVREETVTQPNGESRVVSVVRKDGQVDRTVSTTRLAAGDLRDRDEVFTNGDAAQHVPEVQKEASSTEPIHVTKTVRTLTDTRTQPPSTRTLDRSRTWSQEFQVNSDADSSYDGFAEHELVAGPNGTFNPPGRHLDLSGYDGDSTATVRLAVTETKLRDGRSVDERKVGARAEYQHRIPGGGPLVPRTDTYTLETSRGQRVRETATEEVRGISTDALRHYFDKEEYRDRLGEGSHDFRETVEVNYDGHGNPKPATQRVEAGEIDRPDRPGARSIAVESTYGETNGSLQRAWSYRRADRAADGGVLIREQTSVEGSDVFTNTTGRIDKDGSSHVTSHTYDGDDLLLTEVRHRQQVGAQDVRDANLPAYTGDFLRANDGPFMKESVQIVNESGEEEPRSHASTTFTSRSGQTLQNVQYPDAPEDDSTFLRQPGTDRPFRGRAATGDELQVDSKGGVYRVDSSGARHFVGLLDESPEAWKGLTPVESSTRLTSHVGKLLQSENGASKAVPYVGGLTGTLQLLEGEKVSDDLAGSSGVTEGLAALSKVAATRLGDGGFGRALLGTTSRALGVASTGLGLAGGVAQIAEGDELGGALTLAGTGGAAVGTLAPALTTSAFVPGVGWTVAGLAVVGSLAKFALEHDQEATRTHELEIP